MKMHPLLLLAAIAFWGWQTGEWLVAALAAGSLCTSFYVSLRWALDAKRLYRVADFCIVLGLLLGGYFYFSFGNPRVIVLFFQWMPVFFLPLALAHAYGTEERMKLAVLFWRLRRRPPAKPTTFDPWFPYFVTWIIAAAAANSRDQWFYLGLIALVSWPLLLGRPRSYRIATWATAFAIAIGLGYGLQHNLHVAQLYLEEAVPEWITSGGSLSDPYRSSTNMGSIGKLKESDAIVLRLVPSPGVQPPALLHSASFDVFFDSDWLARGAQFARINPQAAGQWPLAEAAALAQRITIYDYTARLNPVLSLPAGSTLVEAPRAISAERNRLGTVQVQRQPGFFFYNVVFTGVEVFEAAPTDEDLKLPKREREAFEAVAVKLGLKGLPATEALRRVMAHFANGYEYSTYLEEASSRDSPVVDFLLNSKAGHCEYFATATTLLLRAGGVPARYATGFAIREKSEFENAYIARQRHRHAWVHAYINGAWYEVDTTPPSWLAVEAEQSGVWTKVRDLWSWLRFRAAQLWAASDPRQRTFGALLVIVPLLMWLAWRLYRSRNPAQPKRPKAVAVAREFAASDSEYYRIERHLREQGWGRRLCETAQDWLVRLAGEAKMDTAALTEIFALHHRYRFDPLGLSGAQRAALRQNAEQWLAAQRQQARR